MALLPSGQIMLCPLQASQLFGNDPVSLGFRGFQPGLARVVFAHFAFHSCEAFLPERFAADVPGLPELLQGFLVRLLQPAPLRVPFKLLMKSCRSTSYRKMSSRWSPRLMT